jgi:hypothetical protein
MADYYGYATNSTATSATTYGSNAWTYWAGDTTGGSATGNVWIQWQPVGVVPVVSNGQMLTTEYHVELGSQHLPAYEVPVQTPEEIQAAAEAMAVRAAEALRQQQEAERRQLEETRKRNEAQKKANDLLLSLLDKGQKEEYTKNRCITIYRGTKPKWKLLKERSYNVLEYDDNGTLITKHCVQTPTTPLEDQLAAQYLYLHDCPEELIRVANHQNMH